MGSTLSAAVRQLSRFALLRGRGRVDLVRLWGSVRQPFVSQPLTARECADWMGLTPAFIRKAILAGVVVADGTTVKLEAETLMINGRHIHRIHEVKFAEFLVAIGWKHLPRPAPVSELRHA